MEKAGVKVAAYSMHDLVLDQEPAAEADQSVRSGKLQELLLQSDASLPHSLQRLLQHRSRTRLLQHRSRTMAYLRHQQRLLAAEHGKALLETRQALVHSQLLHHTARHSRLVNHTARHSALPTVLQQQQQQDSLQGTGRLETDARHMAAAGLVG